MEVSGGWLLLFPVTLSDEQNDLVFGERRLDRGELRRSPHEKWDYYIGENDDIPKRQDRNAVRRRDALVVSLKSLGQG